MYRDFKVDELDVVYENDKKSTSLYLAQVNGQRVLIKSFSKNSPVLIKEGFEKEKKVYSLKPYRTPKLIKFDQTSITIEYIDGATLGDLVFKSSLVFQQVNDVFESALLFYESLSQKSEDISYGNLFRYLGVLASSGPIQNKNIDVKKLGWLWTKAHRLMLHLLGRVCRYISVIERVFFKINYYQGLSHSDFHYNNILVKNSKSYFIDFERTELKGFFIFDLLFLLVVLEAVDNQDFRIRLNDSLKKELLGSLGKKLTYLTFKYAVLPNRKFRNNLK